MSPISEFTGLWINLANENSINYPTSGLLGYQPKYSYAFMLATRILAVSFWVCVLALTFLFVGNLFPFTKEPNFPPLRPSTMPAPHLSIRTTGSGYDPVELNYLVFNCSIIRWLITTTFSVLLKKNSLICSHLSKLIPRATAGAVYSSRLANQISDGEGLAPNMVDCPPLHRC